ncbi:MAG: Y-family DNA polymerase [Methylococcales bacterium]|nr:Y-family DNA polymerase [Methylococcales bacterium]
MQTRIALVDCNNFYVSCERVFRPDLIGKPVAVLSNNDGCIVARSKEVKDLGIKMGVPLFQVQQLVNRHKIHLFSSNYTLYANMSARVMATLEAFAPSMEVYSIDEAFLDLTGVCPSDPIAYGLLIKKAVFRATGIPVCVGMGPTKTLAKLANFAAKKWPKTQGVVDLSDPERREKLLRIVPVGEVWGIGRRTGAKLDKLGIHSAWDLARQPEKRIHTLFTVVLARTVMELNGTSCLALDEIAPDKQQIICSRSFKQPITDFEGLMRALARFCARAAEKLRHQQALSHRVTVFIRTSPFKPDAPHYERAASQHLALPSQDTRHLLTVTRQLLAAIFKPGYHYQKAGIQLDHFQPITEKQQLDLFAPFGADPNRVNNTALMSAMDQVNRRFPHAITLAATGLVASTSSQGAVSPQYTTSWRDLPKVTCQ